MRKKENIPKKKESSTGKKKNGTSVSFSVPGSVSYSLLILPGTDHLPPLPAADRKELCEPCA
jgi:hypothetical protein